MLGAIAKRMLAKVQNAGRRGIEGAVCNGGSAGVPRSRLGSEGKSSSPGTTLRRGVSAMHVRARKERRAVRNGWLTTIRTRGSATGARGQRRHAV